MKLHTAVNISADRSGTGIQQAGATPGIIDQDFHIQFPCCLIPPGVFRCDVKPASGIVNCTTGDSRIGNCRSSAVGIIPICGNAVTQNGDSLAGQALAAKGTGAIYVAMPLGILEIYHIAVTTLTSISGVALLGAGGRHHNSFVAVLVAGFQGTAFRSRTHRADPLFHAAPAGGVIGGDPASEGMGMVLPQILLQQNIFDGFRHHLMAHSAGMYAVTAKLVDAVVLRAVVIQTADQIQIDHRDIIPGADLDNPIAQIPQRVAVDIFLGLVPVPYGGHGIIPGGDDRGHKIKFCIFQRFCLPQLHDFLTPHMRRAVNRGGVHGIDGAEGIVALLRGAKIVDTHHDGHNIRTGKVGFG